VFGVLISATDPVAVVAVFRELGVPRRLLTLVEGESLLNDGVAIVLTTILVTAALGGAIDMASGVLDFLSVFFGGAAIGFALGLGGAALLPWLDRLTAAALSIAVAYGGFVVAEEILGFSGVMAAVASGVTLGGLAPSRASAPVRELWESLWGGLGYVANALLFLLIGLAIQPSLIVEHAGAIVLAIVAVLAARVIAVVPIVSLLERLAGIPPLGARNEAVLVWGGLRGGVALALALALPEALAHRDMFIAMTGGVVLATLLLNATTVPTLIHGLGLDEPSRADRFLAAVAELRGLRAARRALDELRWNDDDVARHLDQIERSAQEELGRLELAEDEQVRVVLGRGLEVERETYQRLSDLGLLPPAVTRLLLHEVDAEIEEVALGRLVLSGPGDRQPARLDRLTRRAVRRLPQPVGEDRDELSYAEALARRMASERARHALDAFLGMPNVDRTAVREAQETFARWRQEGVAALAEVEERLGERRGKLQRHQAEALSRVVTTERLQALSAIGLLPESLARRVADQLARDLISGS
jgi:CPA1 family monovalent cation:H+ antiporter